MEGTMAVDPQRDQADRPTEHFFPQMRPRGAKVSEWKRRDT